MRLDCDESLERGKEEISQDQKSICVPEGDDERL
jgi:hypothetical protein